MDVGQAVDCQGQPVPWITYPAFDFLKKRITSTMSVFEYGTGNSTLWWEKQVAHLVSCEHDKEWYAAFCNNVKSSTVYLLRRYKGGSRDYCEEILNYRGVFDILVIDGRDRINCARNCLGSLSDSGVVLWDNSDRSEDQEGYEVLENAGFQRLDFWGLGPLSTRGWCTSIFYREHNCLKV